MVSVGDTAGRDMQLALAQHTPKLRVSLAQPQIAVLPYGFLVTFTFAPTPTPRVPQSPCTSLCKDPAGPAGFPEPVQSSSWRHSCRWTAGRRNAHQVLVMWNDNRFTDNRFINR